MNGPQVNAWIPPPQLLPGRLRNELAHGEFQRALSPGPGRPISPGPQAQELQRSISPGPQAHAPGMPVCQPPWGNSSGAVWPAVAPGTPPAQMRPLVLRQGQSSVPPPLQGPGQFPASPSAMTSPSPSKLRARSPSQVVVVPVSPVAPNGRSPNGMPNGIFPHLGNLLTDAERDPGESVELTRGDTTGCSAIEWLDRKLSALSERQAERAEQQAYLTQLRCLAAEGSVVSSPDNLGRSGGMMSILQADHEALRHQVEQLRRQRFETEREREELNRIHEREREELISARAALELDIKGKLQEIKSLEEGVRKTRGIEDAAAGKMGELERRCQALQEELEAERQISKEAIRDRLEAQRLQQDAEADLTAVKEISGKVLNDCRSLQKRVMDLQTGVEEKANMNDCVGSHGARRAETRLSIDEPQQLVTDALLQQRRISALRQELAAEEAAILPAALNSQDLQATMLDRIKDLEFEMSRVHGNVRKSQVGLAGPDQALPLAPTVEVQNRRQSMPYSPTNSFGAARSRNNTRQSTPAVIGGDVQSSWPQASQKTRASFGLNPSSFDQAKALAPLADWASKDYPAIAPLEE